MSAVPSNSVLPSLAGIPVTTATLSVMPGAWSGGGISYGYQWKKAGVAISGATSASYVVAAGDAGSTITCTVTATNSLGSASATSAGVAITALAAPTNTTAPAVSGNVTVGSTVSASSGAWAGYFYALSYQWRRGGSSISGATLASYVLQSADAGLAVDCVVTATNAAGAAAQASSNTISAVGVPVCGVAPVVSGSAVYGSTLSVTSGTWSGGGTFAYAYQWRKAGAAISGATGASYVSALGDVGSAIDCVVTATNAAGSVAAVSGNAVTVTNVLVYYDLTSGSLPSGVTLARASAGTRFNASGLIESLASDVPRFDYDPVTHAALGLLLEGQATNLLKQSLLPHVGYWGGDSGATLAANASMSLIGSNGCTKITETAGANNHYAQQYVAPVTGGTYTLSAYFKAAERSWATLEFWDNIAESGTYFNLATGAVGSSFGSAHTASIKAVGGGVYRCSITWVAASTTAGCKPSAATADGTGYYTGVLGSGILVTATQITNEAVPSSFIQTGNAAAARAADVLQFTIPSGVNTLRYTFDDNSTQDVAVSAGAYTVPTTLSRARIKSIQSL